MALIIRILAKLTDAQGF